MAGCQFGLAGYRIKKFFPKIKMQYIFDFDGVLYTHEFDILYIEKTAKFLKSLKSKIYVVSNNSHVADLMPTQYKKYIAKIIYTPYSKLETIKEIVIDPSCAMFFDDTETHVNEVNCFIKAFLWKPTPL